MMEENRALRDHNVCSHTNPLFLRLWPPTPSAAEGRACHRSRAIVKLSDEAEQGWKLIHVRTHAWCCVDELVASSHFWCQCVCVCVYNCLQNSINTVPRVYKNHALGDQTM